MLKILGANIRHLRRERKMTQTELGKLIDRSPQVLGRYENGETEPPLSIVYRLAEVFEISMGNLLSVDLKKEEVTTISQKKVVDVVEVNLSLVRALKEAQDKYSKLEAKIRQHRDLAKKIGLNQ